MRKKTEKKCIVEATNIKQPEYTLVVHVGSPERPASKDDIEAMQLQIEQIAKDPSLVMVTHHDVSFSYIPRVYLGNPVIK